MDFKKHTTQDRLDYYSFIWSQARLIIAAVALFLGGIPPFVRFSPSGLASTIFSLHTVAYLISGVAAVYLVYRWSQNKQRLFGGKNQKDTIAFFVSVISGINLGLVGLLGTNVGMSITSSKTAFVITGIIYLVAMLYLQQRWKAHGQKLF
ncbi:MAG: hypothetical protein COT81_01720 [Candidatus Buchananbacteria bacterium CG10_big_fil_rev_8_21_14_0_10_42_9]|uniref:Uncharacterized protein n=1 Tax=Candidatus Buchananbacteria bacterium CG10_big_fil_rev_8_21_14_0_10_42_9 TaxID=1974526 RepID=A0A2H0W445_9BACT|nr:MAG: hypothetical protein COT81_01720 [Candidatus Buchananbacteria bacterium CG10_big_fil_rev_8_21_14_0_10_42_9]